MSSEAVERNSGPMSAFLSSIGTTSATLGHTSIRASRMCGLRERQIMPNTSSTLIFVTPASYTPRWGHWSTWRKVRAAKGGVVTFTV